MLFSNITYWITMKFQLQVSFNFGAFQSVTMASACALQCIVRYCQKMNIWWELYCFWLIGFVLEQENWSVEKSLPFVGSDGECTSVYAKPWKQFTILGKVNFFLAPKRVSPFIIPVQWFNGCRRAIPHQPYYRYIL